MKNPTLQTVAGNPENQDRGLIIHDGTRVIFCVADGAGGRSGGTEAAVMVTQLIRQNAAVLKNIESCVDLLRRMDAAIERDAIAGETTCVLAVVTADEVFGASVGDSGGWLVPASGDIINLTREQQRKPFIGNGGVRPTPFKHPRIKGTLLLATDGLLKYTSPEKIAGVCRENSGDIAAERLIELVRYPSGAFPDDVTAIVGGLENSI